MHREDFKCQMSFMLRLRSALLDVRDLVKPPVLAAGKVAAPPCTSVSPGISRSHLRAKQLSLWGHCLFTALTAVLVKVLG